MQKVEAESFDGVLASASWCSRRATNASRSLRLTGLRSFAEVMDKV